LLDIATGQVLARHTLRLSTQIWSADFAPDGGVVALGGNDGQVHLLTGDTLREIGQLPIGTGASWAFASYNADGSVLSAVDERGHIVQWDARPQSWIHRACAIVGRDLTPDEWNTYLPGLRARAPAPPADRRFHAETRRVPAWCARLGRTASERRTHRTGRGLRGARSCPCSTRFTSARNAAACLRVRNVFTFCRSVMSRQFARNVPAALTMCPISFVAVPVA
jgi:hypothetical protein